MKTLGLPADRIDRIMADHRDAGLAANDVALLDAALLLSRHPTWFGSRNIERLRGAGFDDPAILEAVLTTALAEFLCTLSDGLGVQPDFDAWVIPTRTGAWPPSARPGSGEGGADSAAARARPAPGAGGHQAPGAGRYLAAVDLLGEGRLWQRDDRKSGSSGPP